MSHAKMHHPATLSLLAHFVCDHEVESVRRVLQPVCELARASAEALPSNPETTAGLRKLLEALDCFRRAATQGPLPPGL